MGVATGCGCKEVYIDYLILLIPTPLVYICSFLQQHPYFLLIYIYIYIYIIIIIILGNFPVFREL